MFLKKNQFNFPFTEQQKLSIQLEKEKLEQVALQVKQRSKDIEDMVMVGRCGLKVDSYLIQTIY